VTGLIRGCQSLIESLENMLNRVERRLPVPPASTTPFNCHLFVSVPALVKKRPRSLAPPAGACNASDNSRGAWPQFDLARATPARA